MNAEGGNSCYAKKKKKKFKHNTFKLELHNIESQPRQIPLPVREPETLRGGRVYTRYGKPSTLLLSTESDAAIG